MTGYPQSSSVYRWDSSRTRTIQLLGIPIPSINMNSPHSMKGWTSSPPPPATRGQKPWVRTFEPSILGFYSQTTIYLNYESTHDSHINLYTVISTCFHKNQQKPDERNRSPGSNLSLPRSAKRKPEDEAPVDAFLPSADQRPTMSRFCSRNGTWTLIFCR